MRIISFALVASLLMAGSAQAQSLPALGTDPAQTSVSGLSSGGFMAAQFHVAYSASLTGVGIIAGGPFYCAKGNFVTATMQCMANINQPDAVPLAAEALKQASLGGVDALSNLKRQKVYLFHGFTDLTVLEPVVASAATFYTLPVIGVPAASIKFNDSKIPAGHGFITPDYGVACNRSTSPFVNDCEFDQPGETLDWLYGALQARAAKPAGAIVAFSQKPFLADGQSHGMADTGYLYVPNACSTAGAGCRLHVVFHGCRQNAATVKDAVYAHAGYNNWADTNKLVLLYPQTKTTAANNGCWDWWGYDSASYYTKQGPQMAAVYAMIQRLTATK